jgi:hypothetical protein
MEQPSKGLTLHVRLSEKQYQMIEAASEDLGMRNTEFVRYIIIRWFEEKWKTPQSEPSPEDREAIKEPPGKEESP